MLMVFGLPKINTKRDLGVVVESPMKTIQRVATMKKAKQNPCNAIQCHLGWL